MPDLNVGGTPLDEDIRVDKKAEEKVTEEPQPDGENLGLNWHK